MTTTTTTWQLKATPVLTALLCLGSVITFAQTAAALGAWPGKQPIKLVAVFPPGGSVDQGREEQRHQDGLSRADGQRSHRSALTCCITAACSDERLNTKHPAADPIRSCRACCPHAVNAQQVWP